MFTGLIEEIGIISSVVKQSQGAVISVTCSKILDDLKLGDSVAIDGACQTVVKLRTNGFDVEAAKETLDLTTFKDFQTGRKVNLERAMPANGRFGGHIVSGHVDGVGIFKRKTNQGMADVYYFEAPNNVSKYIIYKGSICINGVSLTVASIEGNIFTVSVIPMTLKETNLPNLNTGDKINLESDIFAKYVEKFVFAKDNKTENITMNYLQEYGFLE
ncbi:MAG: riboflavin synthase [bacterium]